MLQLAHLYFTAPRKDSMAFEGMMNRNLSLLKNRNASSKVVYNDSLSATLYEHNVRMAPVTVEIAKKADYNRIFEIYRERFSDASNFKTVFIGKVDMAQLRPLLCQYLATLPSTHKAENSACQRERVLYSQRPIFAEERLGARHVDPCPPDRLHRLGT